MKDIIKLNCIGEEHHYLKKLSKPDGSESKTYILKLTNQHVISGQQGKSKFIMPSGGPYMEEGQKLDEAEATIKHIDFVIGFGYTITFQ